jgi:hypothetical protein
VSKTLERGTVREALGGAEALTGRRMGITIITPGWGSSGYYSAEALAKAATDVVFPAGTQMHIDHQSAEDRETQPAGEVKTLAAYLAEDARWEPEWVDPKTGVKGRLYAEARVTSAWGPHLAELKDVIGTSIVAGAEMSLGEVDGRRGRIIETLFPGVLNRVDFVTHAGRGGHIAEVMEGFKAEAEEKRNVGQWLEARMHAMFTNISDDFYGDGKLTREERITLSGALGEALTAFTARVESDAPQLFERDLWDEPQATDTEANEAANDSPSDPAGANRKETPVGQIQIEESVHADLLEKSGRTTALEADLGTAKDKLTATEAALKEVNDAAATKLVTDALEAVGIKNAPKTTARLIEGYAVKENGALNSEALAETVAEAIAELQVAGGAGQVTGVGHTAPVKESVTRTETDILSALEGGTK